MEDYDEGDLYDYQEDYQITPVNSLTMKRTSSPLESSTSKRARKLFIDDFLTCRRSRRTSYNKRSWPLTGLTYPTCHSLFCKEKWNMDRRRISGKAYTFSLINGI
jgi:hypothetical protein